MSGTRAGALKRHAPALPLEVQLLQLQVVACGIDTLHLTCAHRLTAEWVARLEGLRREAAVARDVGAPLPTVTVGEHRLTVAPHGTGKGPILLVSEEITLICNPNAPTNLPVLLVELRSLFLWARGHLAAVATVEQAVSDLTACPSPDLQVSRLDVCADFTHFAPEPWMLPRFTCRAQRKAELYEEWRTVGGRSKVVKAFRKAAAGGDDTARAALDRLLSEDELSTSLHYSGKLFTGFSWGAGAVVARLYLKTREIQKTQKLWFHEVWKKGGWKCGPVWRMEFQLRRELLKEARASDAPAFAKGKALVELVDGRQRTVPPPAVFKSWASARHHLKGLWGYLATEWLSLRLPRTATQRVRLARPWKQLNRQVRFESQATAGVWRAKLENDHARTLGQGAGYMARGMAERFAMLQPEDLDHFDADAQINAWAAEVREYAATHRGAVEDRALQLWSEREGRKRLYAA